MPSISEVSESNTSHGDDGRAEITVPWTFSWLVGVNDSIRYSRYSFASQKKGGEDRFPPLEREKDRARGSRPEVHGTENELKLKSIESVQSQVRTTERCCTELLVIPMQSAEI